MELEIKGAFKAFMEVRVCMYEVAYLKAHGADLVSKVISRL